MARLVLWMVDVTDPDPYISVKHFKRGDVVDILPDGQHPGVSVENDPRFRVIDVPDMTMSEAASFLASEPGFGEEGQQNKMLQMRAFKFNVDEAPVGLKNEIIKAEAQQGAPIVASRDDVVALRARKPALSDPKVVGDDGVKTLG